MIWGPRAKESTYYNLQVSSWENLSDYILFVFKKKTNKQTSNPQECSNVWFVNHYALIEQNPISLIYDIAT